MSEFKDLNINRDILETILSEYCEGITFSKRDFPNALCKVFIKIPAEEKVGTLNMYLTKGGKTTFFCNEGENTTLSQSVAVFLKERALFDPKNDISISIKKLAQEEFDELLKFLEGYCNAIQVGNKNLTYGVQYIYQSKYGDKIHLNYYTNGTFNVQGQSALLKSQVIEGLSSYLPYGELVEDTLKKYDIKDISKSNVEKLLEARLPFASKMMHNKVKAMLLPVLITERLDIETTDYSFMVFPILRGLEGFLKQLFLDNGITLSTSRNFGTYLEDLTNSNVFKINPSAEAVIACNYTKRSIERLYNFYKKNRHAIFHVDGTIVGTRIIEDIGEARSLINECCEHIEYCSLAILNKDLKYLK